MTLNENDKLLVNDDSTTETITFAQFKDQTVLNDSDKLLVNDGAKTETVTWGQIKTEIGPPETAPVVGSVSLVESNPDADPRFTNQEFVASVSMTEEGVPVSTKTIDAYVEGTVFDTIETSEITDVTVTSFGSLYAGKKWTGNGVSALSINNGMDLVNNDGLVWIHPIDFGDNYTLADTVRGGNKHVRSNTEETQQEQTNMVKDFETTGFVVGNDNQVNKSGTSYISWAFQKAPGFFDVVKYKGNGLNDNKIPHELSADVGLILVKNLKNSFNWAVYHKSLGAEKALVLNKTDVPGSHPRWWYHTEPTSTDFTLGYTNEVNEAGSDHIAYLFADNPSNQIKVGKYYCQNGQTFPENINPSQGNSASNPFKITTGFRPKWIMIKSITNTSHWVIFDDVRGVFYETYPGGQPVSYLFPSTANAEAFDVGIAVYSDGFGVGDNSPFFNNGECVYIAIGDPQDYQTDLEVADSTGLQYLEPGDSVDQDDNAASGTIGSVDTGTNTITLSSSSGTWSANTGNYVVGPEQVQANVKKYLKFDSNGNVSDLLSAPQSPAYETTGTNPSLTLTFPSTFPSGNAPDDELGDGTTLTVEATATNTAGTSGPVTAEVQPEGNSGPALGGMTTLYDGTSDGITPSTRSIVNGIDLAGKGGLVWIKQRSSKGIHFLFDTERGATYYISSDTTQGERGGGKDLLTAFNSDGFELGYSGSINKLNETYVAWTFQKAAGYFDVQLASASSSTDPIVFNHDLAATPGCVIVRRLDENSHWYVYHKDLTSPSNSHYLRLNETISAVYTVNVGWQTVSDTQVSIKNSTMFSSSGEYVAYLFAEDTPGLIKCGSYTGNSGTQTIDVGFEPQWLMVKNADESANWIMQDIKRGMTNPGGKTLYPNSEAKEQAAAYFQSVSNGFVVQGSVAEHNYSGNNYVYIAIAAPTIRSLTQDEFNEQAIKFGTYENRKHVECGQQADANRDALIQHFADQGYSLNDILKYL